MKSKKFLTALAAVLLGGAMLSLAACGGEGEPENPNNPNNPNDPGTSSAVYGLPKAGLGHYITDADLIEDGTERWLVYTTNETSAEEDNVIAIRKGVFEEGTGKGWKYGDETVILRGEEGGWDEYLDSAAIVKGTFSYGEADYGWLMAYAATSDVTGECAQIGLAVATAPDGTWTKVGGSPIVKYTEAIYGKYDGVFAPSLVNYDKESKVRLFFTYADVIGHFTRFRDIDCSDLDAVESLEAWDGSAYVNAPRDPGEIVDGTPSTQFPNADFAYDETQKIFVSAKDVNPASSLAPEVAERVQVIWIAEDELYTTDPGDGWQQIALWDYTNTPDEAYERLYSPCIVTDAYGHVSGSAYEVVFNISELEMDNEDYLFTQNLITLTASEETAE